MSPKGQASGSEYAVPISQESERRCGAVGGLGSGVESDPSCVVALEASKPELRCRFLQETRRIPPLERMVLSVQLVAHLTALPEFQAARRVALYSPLREEPLLDGLVERLVGEGRQVFLPTVLSATALVFRRFEPSSALVAGKMGILEPAPEAEVAAPGTLDVIVIPALAYDRQGVRLGRGKGYYDRTVPGFCPQATLVGVCFSVTLIDALPRDPWDLSVAYVVTDAGVRVSYKD